MPGGLCRSPSRQCTTTYNEVRHHVTDTRGTARMMLLLAALILTMTHPVCVASQDQFHRNHRSRRGAFRTKPQLAFAAPSNDATPWLAQAASASLTYMGLVVCLDRPRGELNINPKHVRIATSQVPGAGLGLYCNKFMEKGTVLGTYPGVVLPLEQNLRKLQQHPACEAYVWRFSDNAMVIDPTNSKGQIESVAKGGNSATFGSTFLMELLGSTFSVDTCLCRINEPPPGASVNIVTDEDLNQRTVTFSLARDVYEGEELFMDYGITYDRSSYGGPPA